MFSNSEAELQSDVRRRSAAVKRDIQCACDAAFLRLRDKERQLLRVVDLVASRQQGDLWAASLLRQQQQQQQQQQQLEQQWEGQADNCPLPPVQTMSLSLDTELLHGAIQRFATVQLDGVMTSPAGVTSSSLPDGLEEYGAEEHLVSHKPLPGNPGSVRVTRPPSLAGYSQYYPNRYQSCASSLTSSDEDEKFELIDGVIPEPIFRSDPISIYKEPCGCVPRPTLDIESLYLMDCVLTPSAAQNTDRHGEEKMDSVSGEKLTTEVPHPLAGCKEAWLLPAVGTAENSAVPSPAAQWQAAMSSDSLYTPASASAPASERHRWLLRQTCRANEPCQTAADCVSDCAERAGRMSLGDWRTGWLLGGGSSGGGGGGDGGSSGGSSGGSGVGCYGAGFAAAAEREDTEDQAGKGTAPDLLAPFKQMENNTTWLAARG